MKKNNNGFVILLTGLLLVASPALAQSGGDYELSLSTVGGGGGVSSGGDFELSVTIGEPEAGESAGGDYELLGGFLPGEPFCVVDFHHFARFTEYWLDAPCNAGNDWCGGADLDQLGDVDGIDFGLFVDEWLYYCPYGWPLR